MVYCMPVTSCETTPSMALLQDLCCSSALRMPSCCSLNSSLRSLVQASIPSRRCTARTLFRLQS